MAIIGTNDTATVRVASLPSGASLANAAGVAVASGWGGDATNVQVALVELAAADASLAVAITGSESVKTANYTVIEADAGSTIVGNSGSALTFSLPAAAGLTLPYQVRIHNIGVGAVTIDPNGAETINGAATLDLAQYKTAVIWTDGTTWRAQVSSAGGGDAIDIAYDNSSGTLKATNLQSVVDEIMSYGPFYAQAYLTGDGTTNDATALNALLAAAGTYSTIELDAGRTYFVTSPIQVPAYRTLVIPRGTTIKAGAGIVGRVIQCTGAGARIVGYGEDSVIDCAGIVGGITASAFAGIRIENVRILNPWIRGISIARAGDYHIKNTQIIWNSAGVTTIAAAIAGGGSDSLYGVLCSASEGGAGGESMNDVVFEGNTVDMTDFTNANIPTTCAGVILRGDEIANTGLVSRMQFNRNKVLLPQYTLTDWAGKRPAAVEVRSQVVYGDFSHNYIAGGDLGLSFGDLSYCGVNNNKVYGTSTYGIESAVTGDNVGISGNEIYAPNGKYGIACTTSADILIASNTIRAGASESLYNGATAISDGACIWLGSGGGILPERCIVEGNNLLADGTGTDGIHCQNAEYHQIKSNAIRLAGNSHGIVFSSGVASTLAHVVGNTQKGGVRSILVTAGASITTLNATGNAAVGTHAYSNLGTVTNLVGAGNSNMTGLPA